MSEKRKLVKEVPRKIAVYGKAGIGKSTTSSHVSVSLAEMGETVMQVGCDPKRDSVALLCHRIIPTIMDTVREARAEDMGLITGGGKDVISSVIFKGYNDIVCAEAGGPRPGVGCAGRGVALALRLLDEYNIFERYNITFAIFDVLGTIVCGGFAQPMRSGYAKETYLVTCGEPLTLHITNNILKAVKRTESEGADVGVAGIICNERNVPFEHEIIEEFAKRTGIPVIGYVPRSTLVQRAEAERKTVIEAFPDSDLANVYRDLAKKVFDNEYVYTPKPLAGIDECIEIVKTYIKE